MLLEELMYLRLPGVASEARKKLVAAAIVMVFGCCGRDGRMLELVDCSVVAQDLFSM